MTKHFFYYIHFLLIVAFAHLSGDTLTVMVVGDIMMGSTYPESNLPPEDGFHLFADVTPVLSSTDLTLGNLEGTLLAGGVCTKQIEKGRCYAFRTPPFFARRLVDAGFDYLNLANNHMNDFGTDGIAATQRACEDAGLAHGGPYSTIGEFDIKGHRLAIVSFSTSPNSNTIFEVEKAQRIVAEHARLHDIVIVSFHGGGEGLKYLHTKDTFEYYLGWPRGNVVKFAHAVIDSGADFVWGHGPHVPRALEIYKDRLIAYSLGNFCTWGFNLGDERGLAPMLEVALDHTGMFCRGMIYSAVQRTYKYLELDSLNHAASLVKKLSEEDFPESSPTIDAEGHIIPPP